MPFLSQKRCQEVVQPSHHLDDVQLDEIDDHDTEPFRAQRVGKDMFEVFYDDCVIDEASGRSNSDDSQTQCVPGNADLRTHADMSDDDPMVELRFFSSEGLSSDPTSSKTQISGAPTISQVLGSSHTSADMVSRSIYSLPESDVIRGVPSTSVMARFGRLLTTNAEAVRCSVEKTEHFAAFVSHNHAVPRLDRFLALAFEYNFMSACLTSMLAGLLCFLGTVFGVLPVLDRARGDEIIQMGVWNAIIIVPVFWLTMLFKHDFTSACCRGPLLFFDKASIDQADTQLKARGINNSPCCIAHSDCMVAIIGPTYFNKLWTMFELCTFLTARGTKHLHVQPSYLCKTVFFGSFVNTVGILVYIGAGLVGGGNLLAFACTVIPLNIAFVITLRKWAKVLWAVSEQVAGFNLSTADCSHEPDREAVRLIVADFARQRGIATHDHTAEEAQERFEDELKVITPKAIDAQLGSAGVPLRFLFCLWLPIMAAGLDSVSSDLRRVYVGTGPTRLVAGTVLKFAINQSYALFSLSCMCFVCVRSTRLSAMTQSHGKRVFILVASLPVMVLVMPSMALIAQLSSNIYTNSSRETSTMQLLGGIAFCAVNTLAIRVFLLGSMRLRFS